MAAAGFAALLLGRFAKEGQVLWIGPEGDLFAPGLVELGLPPERLIVVRVRDRDARLWALEEALRCPGLVAALAEVDRLDLIRSRRLQLAAEAHGVTALLLRPSSARPVASVALTRWQVTSLASTTAARVGKTRAGLGPPRWQLELFRCRGGRTGRWTIEWREEAWHEIADSVPLAAPAGDRPAAPERPTRRRA
jgi:protein ImuA